jgi:alkylhydroperoxidase/carboxymuconolactone decarboxylase family protein YurZ
VVHCGGASIASTAAGQSSLETLLGQLSDVHAVREASPAFFEAASDFWRAPMQGGHLTPRLRELILVGIHASLTVFNVRAVERHVSRALAAGASEREVLDVLITIVAQANHALFFSVPILEEELVAAGVEGVKDARPDADFEAMKQEFLKSRGFWNKDRDVLARLMPEYSRAYDAVSTTSWNSGPLSTKERALVCMAIDSTVTHSYEPGLRRHIRNALAHDASAGELLEVLQLTGMIGLESYILGTSILFGESGRAGKGEPIDATAPSS